MCSWHDAESASRDGSCGHDLRQVVQLRKLQPRPKLAECSARTKWIIWNVWQARETISL